MSRALRALEALPSYPAVTAPGTRLLSCPVCDGCELSYYPDNLSSCADCDHIFQSDLSISAVYDAAYAHKYDSYPHQEISTIRWNFIQQSLALPPHSKILDIGYGNGSFLKHTRQQGMDIYGIDLHGEDFGIPEIGYDSKIAFDLVCFFDSLEHFDVFDNPLSLKTQYAIVSIPDPVDCFLQTPREWRHYRPGEHLHYFSRTSLDLVMHRWGLAHKIAEGHPEDALRGKLRIKDRQYDNIYTAIYGRAAVV